MSSKDDMVVLFLMPKPPEPTKKGGTKRASATSKSMDWNCTLCKTMPCLDDGFNLVAYKRDKKLPSYCAIADPYLTSEVARQNLIMINRGIRKKRTVVIALQEHLTRLNREEAELTVARHQELRKYYKKLTITKVIQRKGKAFKKITKDKVPNLRIRVEVVE